ncbi:putative imidazoleglycerol-phosphate dehydratase [Candidatus Zinderia insecticola CARI]|uniref:Imidazoleglycerol-phosphate dehydratase n=1 Tax=Zinderia insecticola (strain CARI) TaxID=871271 RepID=E0TJ11_ZINIC|nr:putative imidazoleglycerol-phosphate dehydratase [Candidatus Zinderia insecticola CARI]
MFNNLNKEFIILRITKETKVRIKLNFKNFKNSIIKTKINFLNHMLKQFSFFSSINIIIEAVGDNFIDDHHLVEDIGICLGKIFNKLLKYKKGINRYGLSYVPLDDSLSRVIVDISGRSFLIYDVKYNEKNINNFNLNLIKEFFIAFVNNSKMNIHIKNLYGKNSHHQCESIFKSFGISIKKAIKINKNYIPSTKGIL